MPAIFCANTIHLILIIICFVLAWAHWIYYNTCFVIAAAIVAWTVYNTSLSARFCIYARLRENFKCHGFCTNCKFIFNIQFYAHLTRVWIGIEAHTQHNEDNWVWGKCEWLKINSNYTGFYWSTWKREVSISTLNYVILRLNFRHFAISIESALVLPPPHIIPIWHYFVFVDDNATYFTCRCFRKNQSKNLIRK